MYKYLLSLITVFSFIFSVNGQGVQNDECSNAIDLLICGRYVNNEFANNSSADLNTATCGSLKNGQIFKDVWYTYTARTNGLVKLDGCGLSGDAVIAVYATSDCPNSAVQLLACNDDNQGNCSNELSPFVEFNAANNSTYLIRLGSAVPSGIVQGVLSVEDTRSGIDNDDCICAKPITDGLYSYVTSQASNSDIAFDEFSCSESKFYRDAWYTYTPTCNGVVTISSCLSTISTNIAVYEGTTPCEEKAIPVSCDTSFCETGGQIQFLGNANKTYTFRIGSVREELGQVSLLVESTCSPLIDEFEAPFETSGNMADYTNTNCLDKPENTATYKFEVFCPGDYIINSKGSEFYPRFDIGYSNCDNSVLDGETLNFKAGENGFRKRLNLAPGIYYLTVYPDEEGQLGQFNIFVKNAIAGDLNGTITGDVRYDSLVADIVMSGNNCCIDATNDVTFEIVASCKGNYSFDFLSTDTLRPLQIAKAFLTTARCGGELLGSSDPSTRSKPWGFGKIEVELEPGTYYLTVEGIEYTDTLFGPLFNLPIFIERHGEFKMFYQAACDDISISLAGKPNNSGCKDSGAETISVNLTNTGATDYTNFDVKWVLMLDSIGIDSVIESVTTSLKAEESITYSFLKPVPLYETGLYGIAVEVIADKDDIADNSVDTFEFTRSISITDYPYTATFEDLDNKEFVVGGQNSSWRYAEAVRRRFFLPITTAPNSKNGEIYQLSVGGGPDRQYNRYENSFAVSPCFDLTQLICPRVRFDLNYETEYMEDGLIIEYSTNFGSTWKQLGAFGDGKGENWYNVPYLEEGILYEDTKRGAWSGSYYQGGPKDWITCMYPLTGIQDVESVKFRFRFLSGRSGFAQGAVIDNFTVEEAPNDIVLERFTNSLTYCANDGYEMPTGVVLTNNTCETLDSITLILKTNPDNNNFTETIAVNIAPNESGIAEFSQLPILTSELNNLIVKIPNGIDSVTSNNKLVAEVDGSVYNARFNSFSQNFNALGQCDEICSENCNINGAWNNETGLDNADWLVDEGTTPTFATGPSNADGKFAYIEASGCGNRVAMLTSHCVYLDPSRCYTWVLDYHMFGSDIKGLHFDVEVDGQWIEDYAPALLGAQQASSSAKFKTAEINLGGLSGQNIRLRVRGETGAGEYGDIAIDNIKIISNNDKDVELSLDELIVSNPELCSPEASSISMNITNVSCFASPAMETSAALIIYDYARREIAREILTINIPEIQAVETVTVELVDNFELPSNGIYVVEVSAYINDKIQSNNTTETIASLRPFISNYPYEDDFESNNLGWSPNPMYDIVWEHGLANGQTIQAIDGQKSWTTFKDGRYGNNQTAVIESPCFDLSGLCYPTLELDMWWDTEAGRDGAKVQTSIDNGKTWIDLGGFPNPHPAQNWYTNGKVNGITLGNWYEGWSGSKNTGSGSETYVTARFGLSEFIDVQNLRFRVVFGSDQEDYEHDGISIDAVRIYDGKPILELPASIDLCGGNSYEIDIADYLNGTGFAPYNVLWTPTDSFDDGLMNPAIITPANKDHQIPVSVSVTDVTGCPISGSTVLNVVYTPQAEILTDTVCYTDNAIFLEAIDNEGVWKGRGIVDTNSNEFDAWNRTGLGSFEITHYVGNSLGCITYDTATIVVSDQLNALVFGPSELSVCTTDDPIQFRTLNGGGVWSGANVTQSGILDPSTLNPGTYNVYYTFGTETGCFDEDTIVVTIDAPVDIEFAALPEVCNTGNAITLSAQPIGGTWSGSGIVNPFTGTFNPKFSGAGNQNIQYLVQAGGCLVSETIVVPVFEQPDLSLTADRDYFLCTGNIVTIELNENSINRNDGTFNSVRGEERNNIYIFSTTETLNQNPDTLNKGIYTITYDYDANGCIGSSSLTFELSNPLKVSVEKKPACFNEENGVMTALVKGGTQPYSYTWNEGAKIPVNDQKIRNLGPQANVTLTVSDKYKCQVVVPNLRVGENAEITQTLDSVKVKSIVGVKYAEVYVTSQGGTPFQSGSPYDYIWSDGSTNEDILFAQVNELTNSVTDSLDCSAQFSYLIEVDFDALPLGSESLTFSDFAIYPNPSADFFNIEITSNTFTQIVIEDMGGRRVYQTILDPATESIQVDAQSWANGQYIVRFLSESGSQVEQIIKQ